MSTVDAVTIYYNNIWELANTQNQTLTADEQKTQFFYRHMREEFIKLEKIIERKETFYKDTWTDIYQLIGFFSVFQGVWFQGVTQLAAQRTCRFYIIPIILSVLVSVATLVGFFSKFARLRVLQAGLYGEKLRTEVLQSRLRDFGLYGLNFSLEKPDDSRSNDKSLESFFEAQLVKAHLINVFVLGGSLTTFSGLFAWLIYAIMCDEFP